MPSGCPFPLRRSGSFVTVSSLQRKGGPHPDQCDELRAEWHIPVNVPLIGGMFRFREEKRPLLWIEVAAQIAHVVPDVHFIIFGEGPMRSEMESLVSQCGLGERVSAGLVMSSLDSFGAL